MAGLEYAVAAHECQTAALQGWMARENEVCKVVELLIQQGANVNALGDEWLDAESAGCHTVKDKSPLCAAIQRGSPTLVRMLLDAKADPNHTAILGGPAWGAHASAQKPEAFLNDICNGSMRRRSSEDPRSQCDAKILTLLQATVSA